MRILIAEDDLVSRELVQHYLSPFGVCDVTVDGPQAFEAFEKAWEEQRPYDLICLDIMMPGLDGHQVLQEIRQWEEERGIFDDAGVKIIMVTALGDVENINQAFREHCEGYLVKPIIREKLLKILRTLRLIPESDQ